MSASVTIWDCSRESSTPLRKTMAPLTWSSAAASSSCEIMRLMMAAIFFSGSSNMSASVAVARLS